MKNFLQVDIELAKKLWISEKLGIMIQQFTMQNLKSLSKFI